MSDFDGEGLSEEEEDDDEEFNQRSEGETHSYDNS